METAKPRQQMTQV